MAFFFLPVPLAFGLLSEGGLCFTESSALDLISPPAAGCINILQHSLHPRLTSCHCYAVCVVSSERLPGRQMRWIPHSCPLWMWIENSATEGNRTTKYTKKWGSQAKSGQFWKRDCTRKIFVSTCGSIPALMGGEAIIKMVASTWFSPQEQRHPARYLGGYDWKGFTCPCGANAGCLCGANATLVHRLLLSRVKEFSCPHGANATHISFPD